MRLHVSVFERKMSLNFGRNFILLRETPHAIISFEERRYIRVSWYYADPDRQRYTVHKFKCEYEDCQCTGRVWDYTFTLDASKEHTCGTEGTGGYQVARPPRRRSSSSL